ncbi:DEKNAAC105264 [Brettanomyces naardenensis]|uniref:DEKNAAC105264 n=1 Tax=Brettanomyces naardenensis TaxID=13370 RepID=A0A448YSM4_BRENA|nr:DEKNAAC105264 [Brettanomyces naardenensis]
MVSFAVKLKRTFLPKKRTSITVKSNMMRPSRVGVVTNSDSEESFKFVDPEYEVQLEKGSQEEIDQYVIDDEYNSGYISPVDRIILKVVDWSGSAFAFFLTWFVLVAWVIAGIILKAPQTWQIVMQDGQSIQCYIWDTLLMRQQLDDNNGFLRLYGRLTSRAVTHRRLLMLMYPRAKMRSTSTEAIEALNLRDKDWFDRLCTFISRIIGSMPCVIVYWIGVFTWVGCGSLYISTGNPGPYTGERTGSNPQFAKWSNNWQMYINTAVAVVLLTTSVILENVRARNNEYVRDEIENLGMLDCQIESMSRHITGDIEDNETVVVPACERKRFKKVISAYAEIIGTGVGLIFSMAVFIVWISIGHTMGWSSNWWLIIGTYTGLVGYVDGFTLREVYYSITVYEEAKFSELLTQAQELLDIAGINYQLKKPELKGSIGHRISMFVSKACSSQWAVVASFWTVVGLLCIASGLRWSVTGQLICNTPTMIIEAFCMMILIQAHGWADYKRRFVVRELGISRRLLATNIRAYPYEQSATSEASR